MQTDVSGGGGKILNNNLNNDFENKKMFVYFQRISSHIFNYLSCLMMICYRNNHNAVEGAKNSSTFLSSSSSLFVVKNNVMTSLKLIKVL